MERSRISRMVGVATLCIAMLAVLNAGQQQTARATTDDLLRARVVAALTNASDLPGRDIAVEVKSGIVILRGRISASSMRGVTYPTAMMQQSVGAVVRAVPGVKQIQFSIQIEPEGTAGPS